MGLVKRRRCNAGCRTDTHTVEQGLDTLCVTVGSVTCLCIQSLLGESIHRIRCIYARGVGGARRLKGPQELGRMVSVTSTGYRKKLTSAGPMWGCRSSTRNAYVESSSMSSISMVEWLCGCLAKGWECTTTRVGSWCE